MSGVRGQEVDQLDPPSVSREKYSHTHLRAPTQPRPPAHDAALPPRPLPLREQPQPRPGGWVPCPPHAHTHAHTEPHNLLIRSIEVPALPYHTPAPITHPRSSIAQPIFYHPQRLRNAQFLHIELPRRIAQRVVELRDDLPSVLAEKRGVWVGGWVGGRFVLALPCG